MSTIKAIDLRRGMGVVWKDGIWIVVENQKVAKGNWRSSQVVTLKNLKNGQVLDERFRTEELFEQAIFERKPMNYLYSEADNHVFMDMESYEEVRVPVALMGTQSVFLTPNLQVIVGFVDEKAVQVELPASVELIVTDVPPELKGATVTNTMKDAVCEGGARVKVPAFVNNGDHILVDTRTGEYLSRA
ncbi:MAG: elongation factor P [Planctomycetes bacterium]|nr:elongation factor P [Planctomycetota bacterium]